MQEGGREREGEGQGWGNFPIESVGSRVGGDKENIAPRGR
jgi:hypothetical protein